VLRTLQPWGSEVAVDLHEEVDFVPRDAVLARPFELAEVGDDASKAPSRFLFDLPPERLERTLARLRVAAGDVPFAREEAAVVARAGGRTRDPGGR